jgi:hypothetical protein
MGIVLKNPDGSPNAFSLFIDLIIDLCMANKDVPIAITGYQGMGKSTLGILLCLEIAKRMLERGLIPVEWHLSEDGVWSATKKEMHDKIYAKEYTPLLIDEMFTVSSKHSWGSTLALYVESLFLVNRTQKRPYLIIAPRLGGFAENFRNQRIQFNILILKTGRGVVLCRHSDTHVSDPWFLKGLEKDITEMGGDKDAVEQFIFGSEQMSFYQERVNYVCEVRFDALGKRIQGAYDELRSALAARSVALNEPKGNKERVLVAETRLQVTARKLVLQGMSVKEIADLMGTNTTAVNNLLKKENAEQSKLMPKVVENVVV